MDTPQLGLPLIAAAQAQKHVTHNEALHALDALVQLAVLSRSLAEPPVGAADGDRYIVAGGGSGPWAGRGGQVARRLDGEWRFSAPKRGWLAYDLEDGALIAFDGTGWADAITAILVFQNLTRLGLGTTADATNPFSARLNRALWTALRTSDGGSGDLRLALDKEGPLGTASLVFQSGFSGRAELGLLGEDDLTFKVSPNGADWTVAMRADRTTGAVSFPAGLAAPAARRNRLLNGALSVNQRAHASGTPLAAGTYGLDRWKAGSAGCTFTITADPPGQMVTISAGSLIQIVEGAAVEGGAYVLSWTGSAAARIAHSGASPTGAFAPSPLPVLAATAGQPITVEFGPGSLGRVQLEPGRVPGGFEREPPGRELLLCQRYYEKSYALGVAPGTPGGTLVGEFHSHPDGRFATPVRFQVPKRAAPTVTLFDAAGAAGRANVFNGVWSPGGAISLGAIAEGGFSAFGGIPGVTYTSFEWAASAEL